jgi:uncharacterized protein YecT (DUF1311 family)
MKRALVSLVLASLLPLQAAAQYAGPAVETCRAYAEREQREDGRKDAVVVFDNDRHLGIDRYTKKVGAQPVASILYGNGSIVLPNVQAAEMSFVCLLADAQRAVFFYWSLRTDASALAQCTRSPAMRKNATSCIESLLQVTEQDLTQAYAGRFQEARDADAKAGNENASTAIRRSNQAWLAYRDAECARRPDGDARKACIVDLSRRRLLDVR